MQVDPFHGCGNAEQDCFTEAKIFFVFSSSLAAWVYTGWQNLTFVLMYYALFLTLFYLVLMNLLLLSSQCLQKMQSRQH